MQYFFSRKLIISALVVFLLHVDFTAFSQTKKYETVYAESFKNAGKDAYNTQLIKLSLTQPDKKWNNYKGGELHTTDTSFYFNKDLLCFDFPTNSSKITNDYLIFYFSQKTAKCPTLFSLLSYYQPIMEKHLDEQNLPKQLMFIPVVCSAFNPNSTNGIGGVGYWHLNHPQAVRNGLTVNEYIDERKDFDKASKAATLFLKELYQQYNNWELTLAAYSSGVVTVNKILKRLNATTYKEIYEYLPNQTKDFVQAFVAMNFIYSYDNYGAVQLNPSIEADTVTIERKLMLKAINDVINTKNEDFQFLNPVLIADVFPTNYQALFPKGKANKFIEMKDSIYTYQDSVLLRPEPKEPEFVVPKDGEAIEYVVKSGDVLGLIAGKFSVKVSELQAWNNLDGTRINIGQRLMIYGKKAATNQKDKPKPEVKKEEEPEETTTPELKFDSSKFSTYTVQSGDNLWLIAKKYPGISPDNIMEFNGIGSNLDVGQVIKIPKP